MPLNVNFQDILRGDTAQLGRLFEEAALPSSPLLLRNATASNLLQQLLSSDALDASFSPLLAALENTLVQQIAQDDNFYCDAMHPIRQTIECILESCRVWYPRDTKVSQQYFEKVSGFIQTATDYKAHHSLLAALSDIQQWLESENKRATLIESRLCETELNNLKNLFAECLVINNINNAVANKRIPVDLVDGMATILKSELLNCLLTSNTDHLFWKTWQRLLPLIGHVFAGDEADEQLLYQKIPAMLNELERSLDLSPSNSPLYRQWVEQLSLHLTQAIKKQTMVSAPFPPMAFPDGHGSLNTQVTQAVLKQVQNLDIGTWILFYGEHEHIIRCKLALKNIDADQLLFVDHHGRKVMTKSSKDFSVCLSTGIAKILPRLAIDDVIGDTLDELYQRGLQNAAQRNQQLASQKQKAKIVEELELKLAAQRAAKVKAELERKLNEEKAERRAAAQKALAEAQVLAAEKVRREVEIAANEQAERERVKAEQERQEAAQVAEQLQRLQLANIQISALNIGARVELLHNEQPVRCKLAVIIASTGKYIFADNLGRKIAELQREQLLQSLLDNQITLLNNGDSFDDQLVKVIRGLRKDVS